MSNDHIALPESTLKRFGKSGHINYLDINSNTIKPAKTKFFNTCIDYYPDDSEAFLGKKVERELGILSKHMSELDDGKINNLPYSPDDLKEFFFRCVVIQHLRTDKLKHRIRDKSELAKIFNLNEGYFDILRRGYVQSNDKSNWQVVFEKHIDNDINDKVENSIKALLNINKEKVSIPVIIKKGLSSSFLLPSTHFIGVKDSMYFVVSPIHALAVLNQLDVTADVHYMLDDSCIDELIPYAVVTEICHGNNYLVGHKDSLIKAQTYVTRFSRSK